MLAEKGTWMPLKEGAYFDRDVRPSVDNAPLNGEAPEGPEASL